VNEILAPRDGASAGEMPASAMSRQRLLGATTLGVFVAVALLYLYGAAHADPGLSVATEDLEIVRVWIESGRFPLSDANPGHLPKAGYLFYLRAALPHAGADPGENRRFLLLNAGWILLGLGSAAAALGRRFGGVSAISFLVAALACVALRDSADYVASEPVATGLMLMVAAMAIETGDRARIPARFLLGATAIAVSCLRPNLGILTLLILILTGRRSEGIKPSVLAPVGGFLLGLAILGLVGRAIDLPLQPFNRTASRVLLFGTADYYWAPDIGAWPIGNTPAQTSRRQLDKTIRRWEAFFENLDANRVRGLAWRFGHALFSADELPGRWPSPLYRRADRLARQWWWALAILLAAGAAAAAIGGTNAWRFIPAFLAAACVGQGLLFGADPRLALPLLPILMLGLAAALPSARRRTVAAAASLLAAAGCVLFVLRVPDVTAFDFALVRGAGKRITQRIDSSSFPEEGSSAVHFRLAQEPPCPLGLSVFANGRPVLRREPDDPSGWPAYFTALLDDGETAEARRDGLALRIETTGSDSSEAGFVYYPVVPPVLGGRSTVDGREQLPSGFGGETSGALPVWVTSAGPSPRAQRTSVKAGKSVSAIRRNAPSMA
jgi:hypothetical protein